MAGKLSSVSIFFIVFRETLEATIIISVLLGLVEQIARPSLHSEGQSIFVTDWRHSNHIQHQAYLKNQAEKANTEKDKDMSGGQEGVLVLTRDDNAVDDEEGEVDTKRLIRRLRLQIFFGSALGLFIALVVGAAFIAVFFTEASALWAQTEELWEGIFSLIASLIILAIGLVMLKLDDAQVKWRVKLLHAIEKSKLDEDALAGQSIISFFPFITVLREGLEMVVLVGGVSLGQSARSIPIVAIVGIICGLVCGFIVYVFASCSTLITFLVIMTNPRSHRHRIVQQVRRQLPTI